MPKTFQDAIMFNKLISPECFLPSVHIAVSFMIFLINIQFSSVAHIYDSLCIYI